MRGKGSKLLLCCVLIFWAASSALAVPTNITVRVKSKGGKFIGTSMGGVLITLKDADTGGLLAKGIATGDTGNTELIMKTPRRGVISGPGASKFTATIDIDQPTRVEVTVLGPLAQRQSANRVSSTQWVFPGKHITDGNGWMLQMPGFVVDVLNPPAAITFTSVSEGITVRANIMMMCGCPITPGGLWNADGLDIKAVVTKNGQNSESIDLKYADKPSQFRGVVPIDEKGVYELTVYAYDPTNGNTGLDRTTFRVK